MAHGCSSTDVHSFNYKDFYDKVSIGTNHGEFGEVYGARHHMFHKVAIRIISRQYHITQSERALLQQEAKKLFSVVSDNVIRLLGTVMEPEHLCLVFEYAEYGHLGKILLQHELPWPLKIRMSHEIAMGMSFLHHQDILHLRLKCSNILVTGNVKIKLSDIGLSGNWEMNNWTRCARIYSQTRQITQSRPGGSSVAHVPPELIRDVNAAPDKSADVYAYGIVLWQILTNKAPYEGQDTSVTCTSVIAGERPDINLVSREHPKILYSIMIKSWDAEKRNRPTFGNLVAEIVPVAASCESGARKAALECQRIIHDFYFPDKQMGAPTGDQEYQSGMGTGRADAPSHIGVRGMQHPDGIPTPMRTDDETTPKSSTSVGESQKPALPLISPTEPVQHRFVVGTVTPPPENKNPLGHTNAHTPTDLPEERASNIISVEELYVVAEELGRNWRRFGLTLGFSDAQLDNIEANYHRHGFPETPYQMLRKWKESEGTVTVGYLYDTLRNARMCHVAQKLAEKVIKL